MLPHSPLPVESPANLDITPWITAGVQHAVLMRALPVVRHDMAGPLSVIRMGSAVLKRRLAQPDCEPAQVLERVDQLDAHLLELSEQIRRLRFWDRGNSERLPVRQMLLEAVALAQPHMGMRGVSVAPPSEAGWPEDLPAHPSLLYAVLASLYYLTEQTAVAAGEIHLVPAPNALHIQMSAADPERLALMDPPPLPTAPIDAAALQALARGCGLSIQVSTHEVRLAWSCTQEER